MRSAIHKKENREVGPIVIPGERARSLRLQTADMVLIASCPSDKLCLGDVSFWGIFVTKQIKIEVRLLACKSLFTREQISGKYYYFVLLNTYKQCAKLLSTDMLDRLKSNLYFPEEGNNVHSDFNYLLEP